MAYPRTLNYARLLPVSEPCDLVVCGEGPSGLAAALAAESGPLDPFALAPLQVMAPCMALAADGRDGRVLRVPAAAPGRCDGMAEGTFRSRARLLGAS